MGVTKIEALESLGWDSFWQDGLEGFPDLVPCRIMVDHKVSYLVSGEFYQLKEAFLSGQLQQEENSLKPVVGDWVMIDVSKEQAIIQFCLPRKTCFSRKKPGRSSEFQVMMSNVDIIAIITEPGKDFNLRRLERYLTLINSGGAKAIILINKSDLFSSSKLDRVIQKIRSNQKEVPIHLTSCFDSTGKSILQSYLKRGITLALVGSSGVGKSTLINQLLGESVLETGQINASTGKGRHTTTARSISCLSSGGLLVDNPGLRELYLHGDKSALIPQFSLIQTLSQKCQYLDCDHKVQDKGCAIQQALVENELNPIQYQAYLKLKTELAEVALRRKERNQFLERRKKRKAQSRLRNPADRMDSDRQKTPKVEFDDWE